MTNEWINQTSDSHSSSIPSAAIIPSTALIYSSGMEEPAEKWEYDTHFWNLL